MEVQLNRHFNTETFLVACFLQLKCSNTDSSVLQLFPIKKTIYKIDINRSRIGFITDFLTSVDTQEKVKIRLKVVNNFEVIFNAKNKRKVVVKDY